MIYDLEPSEWIFLHGFRPWLIGRWLMIAQHNPETTVSGQTHPTHHHRPPRKQSTLQGHCRSFCSSNTSHQCEVSSCSTWVRVFRINKIPSSKKLYLVNVQQILWDRTNLCHHGNLRAQDNAQLPRAVSIKLSTDRPWRPHSCVLKLFIATSSNHSH